MKLLTKLAGTALMSLVLAAPASAEQDFGATVKVSTLGAGLEGSWQPFKYLAFRVGGNFFNYDTDGGQAGIDYEQEWSLESFYVTANVHFDNSPMRLTAGLYANGNELFMINDTLDDQDIGGIVYPGGGIGVLTSTTTFPSTAPYFGVGYDFDLKGNFGWSVDVGVLWQGEPEVTLAADGPLAGDPGFQLALEAERRELQSDMNDYKAYPVLQLGVTYRFSF